MRNLGRALLLVGVLVLALLIGLLIGRSQRAQPLANGNAAVQITTVAPPPVKAPEPLPAAAPAVPKVASVPKIAPDLQVQEDAAAVGMTTREDAAPPSGDEAPPAPRSADTGASSEPIG